jgi:hypothetical protein
LTSSYAKYQCWEVLAFYEEPLAPVLEKKIRMDLVLISVSQKMEPWVLFWFSS